MRRVSLPILALAVAGLLLGACDFRREEEAGVRAADSGDRCEETAPITPTSEAATPTLEPTDDPATPQASEAGEASASPSPAGVRAVTSGQASPTPDGSPPETAPAETGTVSPRAEPTATPCEPEVISEEPSLASDGFIVFTRPEAPVDAQPYPHWLLWRSRLDGSEQERIELPADCAGIGAMDLSPDGEKLVFSCDERGRGLRILDFTSMEVRRIEESRYAFGHWSPDSQRIAYGAKGDFHVYDIATGIDQIISTLPAEEVEGWTPDGRVVLNLVRGPLPPEDCPPGLFRRGCLSVAAIDPDTRDTTTIPDVASHVAWSSDAQKVVAFVHLSEITEDPEQQVYDSLELIDMVTGERQRITSPSSDAFAVAWLPGDQRFLASVVEEGGGCSVWDIDASDPGTRRMVADGCGVVYLTRDGKSYFAGQHSELASVAAPPAVNLWRFEISRGEKTLVLEDVGGAEVWEASED